MDRLAREFRDLWLKVAEALHVEDVVVWLSKKLERVSTRCEAVNPETGELCDRPVGHPGFHVAGDHQDPEATVWKSDRETEDAS